MRIGLFVLGLLVVMIAGCGNGLGKVKGRIVENGQPKTFPPTSHSVELTLLGPSGQPDTMKTFTAVVDADGTFEVHASGGQVPPGAYQITIQGPYTKKGPKAAATRDIKSGDNEITLDLAKPGE